MTRTQTFLHAFGGGEIATEMVGRVDDPRRQQGALRVRNMVVTPQGPVTRRNGSRFIRPTKNNGPARLITFRFSPEEALGIEVGAGYFRFVSNCSTVLLGSTPRTYIGSRNITAADFDGATNQITFPTAHNLVAGDTLVFTFDGNGPPELNEFQVYAVIVVSSTVIRLALTADAALAGQALDFGAPVGSGTSGIRVHFAYERRSLVRFGSHNFYCARRLPFDTAPGSTPTPAACTMAGNFVSLTAHGFVPGTAVVFAGALLPASIVAGRVYYVDEGGSAGTFAITEEYGSGETLALGSGSGTVARATVWHELEDDIYEIPNNYVESDLDALTWDSSFDIVTLCRLGKPAGELRRFGATSWEFVPVEFEPSVEPPEAPTVDVVFGVTTRVSATDSSLSGTLVIFQTEHNHNFAEGEIVVWSGGGTVVGSLGGVLNGNGEFFRVARTTDGQKFWLRTIDTGVGLTVSPAGVISVSGTINLRVTSLTSEQEHEYGITSVADDGRESRLSATVSATNNLSTEGSSNTLEWARQSGVARYNVYKKENGLFAFIGAVEEDNSAGPRTFKDDGGIAPDLGVTPPRFDESLSGTDYPGAVAHFEQRRLFAGSTLFPQRVWATRTGTEVDLTFHLPVLDDDRILFDIASRESERVRHIIPLSQLLLLTSAAEYRVTPVNSDAITPTSIAVRPQTYIGASPTQPVIVNNTVVFAAARGGHLREMGFDSAQASYITGDLSLRSRHLFDGFELRDLRLAVSPIPIVWCVSSSGLLLGLTYSPEEQIGSWHVHETDGVFESCTVVPEGAFDNLYVIVQREIDGNTVRYLECIEGAPPATFNDSFFVDCGLTYEGPPATVISGLGHLEGEAVAVLADGVVRFATVVGGQITLPKAASKVHVGSRMTSYLQTTPLLTQLPGFGQGVVKNIDEVSVRVLDSAQFDVGVPSALGVMARSVTSTGLTKTEARTKQIDVTVLPEWNQDGSLLLRQADPLPWTLVSLTLHATSGG